MKDLGIVARIGFSYYLINPEHIGKLMQIAGESVEVRYWSSDKYQIMPDSAPFISHTTFGEIVGPDDGGNAAEPIQPAAPVQPDKNDPNEVIF